MTEKSPRRSLLLAVSLGGIVGGLAVTALVVRGTPPSAPQPAAAWADSPFVETADGADPSRSALASTAPLAEAYELPARLNEVARHYSLGVGEVRCPAPEEWEALYGSWGAWGITNVREDWAMLAPFVCAGALSVGGSTLPLWQQAAGVWLLVHEAFHLRHWRYRRDEGKVSCQTIVYFTEAAVKLGATAVQADELFPYALALYDRQGRLYYWYRDPTCVLPLWQVPPEPANDGTPPAPAKTSP